MNAFSAAMSVMDEALATSTIDAPTALAMSLHPASEHEPEAWELAAKTLRSFIEHGNENIEARAQLCEIKGAVRRADDYGVSIVTFTEIERAAQIGTQP